MHAADDQRPPFHQHMQVIALPDPERDVGWEVDALGGMACLGDIGHHFPDTDPAFKGADSMVLLKEAMAAVRARGWRLGNIDATIIAQQPKMKPWLPGMITALSAAIGCHPAQINVKAKTNEKVGTVGRCESIAALASALLVR